MDFLNPDLWKTAIVQDWLAILAVWTVLFVGSLYLGSMLFHGWQRIAKSRRATLQFVTYERGTFWTKASLGLEEIVQVRGVWHVTNASFRQVALRHFRLRSVTTDHHLLAVQGSDNSAQLLLAGGKYDVEINCVIRKRKGRQPKSFRADVCFKDSDGKEHWVRRVPFAYRGSAQD